MKQITFKEYRMLDLIIFAVITIIFEAIATYASGKWFWAQAVNISVTLLLVCIVMMRWSGWAAIHAVVGGLVYCFAAGATAEQYIVYCVGNLFALIALLLIKYIGKEKISYKVDIHDVRQDDEYLKANNSSKDIIDRIMLVLKAILSFLATPLMEYQAKVPMIKPPITKTNVLKMNNNFKGAVALYDYIVSYDKPGYIIEPQAITYSPFTTEMGEEFALAGGMLDFLMYEYGLGLKSDLKLAYELEEERRKDALVQRGKEQIIALNKRLKKAEISLEEYIIKLEEQIKLLEKQCERLELLRKEIERLKLNENKLMADIKTAYLDISKLKSDLLAVVAALCIVGCESSLNTKVEGITDSSKCTGGTRGVTYPDSILGYTEKIIGLILGLVTAVFTVVGCAGEAAYDTKGKCEYKHKCQKLKYCVFHLFFSFIEVLTFIIFSQMMQMFQKDWLSKKLFISVFDDICKL